MCGAVQGATGRKRSVKVSNGEEYIISGINLHHVNISWCRVVQSLRFPLYFHEQGARVRLNTTSGD